MTSWEECVGICKRHSGPLLVSVRKQQRRRLHMGLLDREWPIYLRSNGKYQLVVESEKYEIGGIKWCALISTLSLRLRVFLSAQFTHTSRLSGIFFFKDLKSVHFSEYRRTKVAPFYTSTYLALEWNWTCASTSLRQLLHQAISLQLVWNNTKGHFQCSGIVGSTSQSHSL